MNLWKLFAILLLSSALAGYSTWVRVTQPAREVKLIAPTNSIPLVMKHEEAHSLWRRDTTLFVDVRTVEEFAEGHIAGAINLPQERIDERFSALKEKLTRSVDIVVYCKNLDCAKSLWGAIWLQRQGLTQIKIYPAGWHDWQRHNLPSASGAR